jgi:hypothetical protein
MNKRCRLLLELLETRFAPATFGVPWPDPEHLTLSFAPDGTHVGTQVSSLFRTLNATLPTQAWESALLRAFQTWADQAPIHIRVVHDSGLPLGTLGLKEGDPRFGDIRIAAVPLAADVVAIAEPYDPFVANTSVGDILLNSNYRFGQGAQQGYDLFTVLLHEAGHVFGLPDSDNPASAMFENFTHARTGLSSGDVDGLHALYGSPRSGGDDATTYPQTSVSLPGNVSLLLTTPGYVEHTYYEQIDTLAPTMPVQTYVIRSADIGAGLTNVMTVAVRTADSTSPHYQVQVFDSQWNPLPATVLFNQAGSLEVRVPRVLSNQNYYVELTSGDVSVAGVTNRFDAVVDFARADRPLPAFVRGVLQPGAAAEVRALDVPQSQQMHFILSATDWGAPAATGVTLTIRNSRGRVVFSLDAASGAQRSGDALLDAGHYTIRFTRDNGARTGVLFELDAGGLSDPLGPQLHDTILAPAADPNLPAAAAVTAFFLPHGIPAPAGSPAPVASVSASPVTFAVPPLTSAFSFTATPSFGPLAAAPAAPLTATSIVGVVAPDVGAAGRFLGAAPADSIPTPPAPTGVPTLEPEVIATPVTQQPGSPPSPAVHVPAPAAALQAGDTSAATAPTEAPPADTALTPRLLGLSWAVGVGIFVLRRFGLPLRRSKRLVPTLSTRKVASMPV